MADDSTDSAVKEQCGVYIICSKFLSLQRIVGHPDAENELCKFYIVTFLKISLLYVISFLSYASSISRRRRR